MSTTKRGLRALLATLIAAAFAMVALVVAPVANAADGNIDPNQKGKLTVHKYENPTWGQTADGTAITSIPETAKALDGVPFKITKLQFDMADPADWAKIEGKTPDDVTIPAATGDDAFTKTVTTANGGQAVFDELSQGLYLVEELAVPASAEGEPQEPYISKKAAPFFVTVPLPNADNWNYDIHVYPKNTVTDKPTKEVNDSEAFKPGDEFTWTIKSQLPKTDDNNQIESVVVSDKIDAKLTWSKVVSVKLITPAADEGSEQTEQTLTAGTDYTVEEPSADNQNTVTVTLGTTGLALANADGGGKTLEVVIQTTANAPGVIKNIANVTVDNATLKTNEEDTDWGQLQINKQDSKNQQALAGAVFEIYAAGDDGEPTGDAIVTLTTGDNGKTPVQVLKAGNYIAKEIAAPAGYKLPAEPNFPVTVVAHETTVSSIDVDNTRAEGPALPITGASGQLLMTIGGGALLLLAVGTAFVVVRRRA